ncbi:MAG: purine-binding chemotaxis protein CheW [Gammaproteobacteria bacterium]|nr:purine-binding chemotaxis protein CheW [Gammaproteobacteria bacterium]
METQSQSAETEADTSQYLTFMLAGEEYGVDILRVQEIKCWDSVTSIPNTPDFVKGVINLRGTIVPIVDLRERFDLDSKEYGPTTVVIVLKVITEEEDRIMGIVVDAVSDVYNVTDESIRPTPEIGGVIDTGFVRGLASVDKKMVIFLEIDQLINNGVMDNVLEAAH